jgi:hypothetical protein
MFEFLSKFKRNRVWSLAVYVEPSDFSFEKKPRAVWFVLNAKKRRKSGHIHTFADPFLFPFGGELYLFYESQAVGEDGKIDAYKTRDLSEFEYVGEVLKEPFHLSYPFVFSEGSSVFLIPETSSQNEVSLYKFEDFPYKPVRSRVLLKGPYVDSSMFKHGGLWYLFTTSNDGLEIFFTDNIETGELESHPCNPITNDPKYKRCGGSIIEINDKIYRIAQDGSSEYGKNISILQVNELSKNSYHEELLVSDYFELNETWNSKGGHHLSVAQFNHQWVMAVDGKQNDLYMNKLLTLIYRH